jgi:4-hydroxy-tetrahydrodipicolinate synthase
MHPNTRLPIIELAESAKAEVASAIAEIGDEDLACPSESWRGLRLRYDPAAAFHRHLK